MLLGMKNNNVGDERTSSQWFCVWQRSGIILESNTYKKWKFVNAILLLMSHNNSWLFLHGISDWGMMVCHQRPCLFIVQPLIRWLYIFSLHIAGKSWNQFVSDGLTLYRRKQVRAHAVITIDLQKLSKRNLGHKKMAVSLFSTSPNFTYSS